MKEDQYEEEEESWYSGPAPECEDLIEDESCDTHLIEQTEKGFRCAIDVPSVLYKYIIGKKGETRRRLEHDTRTSISIPKQGVEGQIVVTGAQKSAVSMAITRLEILIDSFRKKQPFTHFLSLPLNQPQIQQGFLKFKEDVLEACSQDHGVEESIFQNPSKLHLTLGTLCLLNEAEVQAVGQQLQQNQDFIRELTGGKPLELRVRGIEYMNDDPAAVDVLYAKVCEKHGSDKLQLLADRLVEQFVSQGLMQREWDRVKLHGTVMNTLFRRDSTAEGSGSGGKSREAFDARNILKTFGSFDFGDLQLNSVLLSQRFSSDCSGYYCTAAAISFSPTQLS
uniref:K Homology domain-containing protein n=1 Tax=Knipowitschia caucasica TaxID=637954 RepID=A0AAV2LHF8_KNICA